MDADITPLVDVIFILLVFLLLLLQLVQQKQIDLTTVSKVQFPVMSDADHLEKIQNLLVIEKNGSILVNGNSFNLETKPELLRQNILSLNQKDKQAGFVLAADRDVPLGRVMHLIGILQNAGIKKSSILVEPLQTETD